MTAPPPDKRESLPLSVLIDQMVGDGARDEHFVRRFSDWFHEKASSLRLDAITALGLTDVVLTFRMRGSVSLVATGYHPDVPGEVTVRFHEQDFPAIVVRVELEPAGSPYEICTLDYAPEGRPMVLIAPVHRAGTVLAPGATGRAVVAATIGGRRELRVALDELPRPVNLPPETWRWLDESPSGGGAR